LDSRPAGIALVVLILSTAVVVTLAVIRPEPAPVVLLQNSYPQRITSIEREGERFHFAHAFFVRRDMAELEIRFSLLHSSPMPEIEGNGTDHSFSNYVEIGILRDYLGIDEIPFDQFDAEVDGGPGGCVIRVCDLGRTLQCHSSPGSTDSLWDAFGQFVNGTGDPSFLRGISDFFYEREENVEYLVVARGKDEDSYSSTGGQEPIGNAPKGGTVILQDVRKGEMVVVEFSVVPHKEHMPERTWNRNYDREFYQVIRAYADGELIVAKANRVEVDLI
jgi:hypothetical protein